MIGRSTWVHRAVPWLLLAMALLALAACTGTGQPGAGNPRNAGPVSRPARHTGPATYKVGQAYQVDGQWYYPKVELAYEERGIASWYGPNFHGKKTANGEKFDMNLISAAHKTLQLPSVVRVTSLENGRSLVIRVNDRGPFVRGRIIDLSRRAAELLGFTTDGTAMVHIRVLAEESRQAALAAGASAKDILSFGQPTPKAAPSVPVSVEALAPADGVAVSAPTSPPALPRSARTASRHGAPPPYGGVAAVAGNRATPVPAARPVDPVSQRPAPIDVASLPTREKVEQMPVRGKPAIFVQAGAFRKFVNANRMRARLTRLGQPVRVSQVYVSNQPFFRVRLGPLNTVADADQTLGWVVGLGYPDARIVVD